MDEHGIIVGDNMRDSSMNHPQYRFMNLGILIWVGDWDGDYSSDPK